MSKHRAELDRKIDFESNSPANRIVQIARDDFSLVAGGLCYIDQNGQVVCDAGRPRQQ